MGLYTFWSIEHYLRIFIGGFMKVSRKNLEAIADRLAWYEQLIAGKTMAWQNCGICSTCYVVGRNNNCDSCAIKPPKHSVCNTYARHDLFVCLHEKYSKRKKSLIKELAQIRYQELIDRLNKNGYEYK